MENQERLELILKEQKEQFLKKEPGIKRNALTNLEKWLMYPHVLVITGLRRSGKSTLLRQIAEFSLKESDYYYINFEDERFRSFQAEDFNDIYTSLLKIFGAKKIFLIDEIQNVKLFESFVRRFYDNGFKFIITGSNSQLLSNEFGTKLTGRHLDLTLKPFTFKEFLVYNKFPISDNNLYVTEMRAELLNYFNDYLMNGGMPEFVRYHENEMMKRVYDDIVIKDIVVRYNINNVQQIRELYQYLITNFARLFSFRTLEKTLKAGSYQSIQRYIAHLEESHLSKTILKYDHSYKKQIVNNRKFYVMDNGFIRIVSTKSTTDKGRMLENLVLNQLDPDNEIYYFSQKNECDFLLKSNTGFQAIQVCLELDDENRNREINGLLEALNFFDLSEGLLLTLDQENEITKDNKRIIVQPVWRWLMGN